MVTIKIPINIRTRYYDFRKELSDSLGYIINESIDFDTVDWSTWIVIGVTEEQATIVMIKYPNAIIIK